MSNVLDMKWCRVLANFGKINFLEKSWKICKKIKVSNEIIKS